jgi:chemotaxis protein CheX
MPSATIEVSTAPAVETLPIDYMAALMTHSVMEVFSAMLSLEVCAEAPQIRTAVDVQTDGVVALVGLTGDWTGTGVLSCSAGSACWISGRFLMSEYEEVNDDVLDAAGEITNMVIGGFKNALADRTGPLGMSIPAIVYGREMRTSSKGGCKDWCAFPFSCEGKAFEFLIRLQPATPRASRSPA